MRTLVIMSKLIAGRTAGLRPDCSPPPRRVRKRPAELSGRPLPVVLDHPGRRHRKSGVPVARPLAPGCALERSVQSSNRANARRLIHGTDTRDSYSTSYRRLRRLYALVSAGGSVRRVTSIHAGECRDALHNALRISHDSAAEVVAGIDLTGKKAIVTGGAGGIGAETARALAAVGASVTLAVRRTDAAKTVVAELRQSTGNEAIDVRSLDLSDLRSVKAFTDAWEGPVHILVNNAGIMAVPELEKTAQGFELQFGTNFLGHFALTTGLHKVLAAANGARVVSVSSSGHLFSPVVFDDLNFDFIPYTPFGAYGQSKTANALLAIGITCRWADDGIRSNALHPGAIATGLQKYTGGIKTPPDRRKTVQQGASTSVLLAASPLLEDISGRYFEDCNEAQQVMKRPTDFTGGYAAYAVDPANAERLWDESLRLIS